MKNTKIKSLLLSAILALCLCFSLCGCGRTGTCDGCGQKTELTKYVSQIDGEVSHYCDFCLNMAKMLGY